ncbi:MAG: hypothetical protein HKN39_07650 [Flavobacteriales bacterium]|nr:hypothetical protein [Flavobacteriales bacterium]
MLNQIQYSIILSITGTPTTDQGRHSVPYSHKVQTQPQMLLGNVNSALNFSGSGSELWIDSGDMIDFGLTTSFSFVTDFKTVSSATQYFFRDLLTKGNGW